MKSREEYQASIFAKRDALLRKRKKHITQAVSGTAAAVLLTASFIIVPKMTAKLPLGSEQTVPDITTTQTVFKEESITQQHSDYDSYAENEDAGDTVSETASVTYAYYLTSDETTAAAASETKKSPETDEIAPESASQIQSETQASDMIYEEAMPENEAFLSYETIAETAFGYLPENFQTECIDKDNPYIIPVTSATDSVYQVTFHTVVEESYQVTVRQDNLELVEIKILNPRQIQNDYEDTTHKDGYKGE